MNELIKVNYDSDRPTVLARDLHNEAESARRKKGGLTKCRENRTDTASSWNC